MEVKELVLYSIKPAHRNDTDLLLSKLRNKVSTLAGYVKHETYHACKSPEKLMDLVTWESLAYAEAAITTVKNDPEYAEISAFFEEVTHFEHYFFLQ